MPALDLSGEYNTPLDPQEEGMFQAWAEKTGRARDVYDYDLRGAWKDNAKAAMNGHLPDTYKKPNHPTFSQESVYAKKVGGAGAWAQQGKKWVFKAGPENLKNFGADGLKLYFQHVEPDALLVLPEAH